MQVSVESTGDIERKLIVEVPAERVDLEVEKRLKDMRGKVRLAGFRPGKIPLNVVEERYGQGVHQEVIGEVIQQSFNEAVKQENLRVAGAPSSVVPEAPTLGQPLKYTAILEVYPDIEIGAIETIEVTRQSASITAADMDKMIEILRKQQQSWETKDTVVNDGDRVILNFDGTIDGEPFEGGKMEAFSMEVGKGQMIPAFEQAVIGMQAGDEKDTDVTFPDDYHVDVLKGKTVQFHVQVTAVNEAVLPELNDEFYKKFGVEDGSEESFKAEVEKNMQRELAKKLRSHVKQSVMNGLDEIHEITTPTSLVTDEITAMRAEMSQNNSNIDTSSLSDDMFKKEAERRVKLGLIVGAIIMQNKLKKDQVRADEMIEQLSASYEDPASVIKHYNSNLQAMQTIEAAVLEEMIVDWVLERAKVTEEVVDFDAVMHMDQKTAA